MRECLSAEGNSQPQTITILCPTEEECEIQNSPLPEDVP
jgi:hypothetical protein